MNLLDKLPDGLRFHVFIDNYFNSVKPTVVHRMHRYPQERYGMMYDVVLRVRVRD